MIWNVYLGGGVLGYGERFDEILIIDLQSPAGNWSGYYRACVVADLGWCMRKGRWDGRIGFNYLGVPFKTGFLITYGQYAVCKGSPSRSKYSLMISIGCFRKRSWDGRIRCFTPAGGNRCRQVSHAPCSTVKFLRSTVALHHIMTLVSLI